MAVITALVDYLSASLMPVTNLDPVYQTLVDTNTLESIITRSAEERGYTVAALPKKEVSVVILLSKKELYLRLATTSAPEFDIEERYTKILRSQRFDHYLKLVQQVQVELKILSDSGQLHVIQNGDLILRSKDGASKRNYDLGSEQDGVVLTIDNVASDHIDVSWTPYDAPNSSAFLEYRLLLGLEELYDPYQDAATISSYNTVIMGSMFPVNFVKMDKVIQNFAFTDIRRNKARINSLTPATQYYLVVCLRAADGNTTLAIANCTTLT